MSGIVGAFERPQLVAVMVLFSAKLLFAQEGYSTRSSNTDGLVGLVAFIVFGIVFYSVYRKLKQKGSKAPSKALNFAQRVVSEKVATITPEWLKTSLKDAPAPPSGAKPVSKSIFISYRRQDSAYITGRIYDTLTERFGKTAVFKDVDSMPLGYDFRDHIREQVGHCGVLIAVIGKTWNASSPSGERRLNDQRDHLRIEIETALERRIPVIPVLVDGVEMPTENELPASLGRLAYHHGISVRPDPDFHNDADRLARGIEPLLK
jgi:hypothetical protein